MQFSAFTGVFHRLKKNSVFHRFKKQCVSKHKICAVLNSFSNLWTTFQTHNTVEPRIFLVWFWAFGSKIKTKANLVSCGKEWQIQCEHVVCREAGDTFGRTKERNLCLSASAIGIGHPSFVPKTVLKSHSWRPTTSHKAKWAPIKEFCILTQKGGKRGWSWWVWTEYNIYVCEAVKE